MLSQFPQIPSFSISILKLTCFRYFPCSSQFNITENNKCQYISIYPSIEIFVSFEIVQLQKGLLFPGQNRVFTWLHIQTMTY